MLSDFSITLLINLRDTNPKALVLVPLALVLLVLGILVLVLLVLVMLVLLPLRCACAAKQFLQDLRDFVAAHDGRWPTSGRQAVSQEERGLGRALAKHKHYDDLPEDVKAQLEELRGECVARASTDRLASLLEELAEFRDAHQRFPGATHQANQHRLPGERQLARQLALVRRAVCSSAPGPGPG